MNTNDTLAKVQMVSDGMHSTTETLDRLIADIARLTALTVEARIETGMTGLESQRAMSHLANVAPGLAEARKELTLAHAAAEKSAPKASFPWECPENATIAEADAASSPRLKAVGE